MSSDMVPVECVVSVNQTTVMLEGCKPFVVPGSFCPEPFGVKISDGALRLIGRDDRQHVMDVQKEIRQSDQPTGSRSVKLELSKSAFRRLQGYLLWAERCHRTAQRSRTHAALSH